MLFHPVAFSNADTFCRCKPLRQVQVDVAVQFAQLFLADGSLHFYCCSPEILGQQDGTVHAFKVNRMLVALSTSPSGKLDYQTKPDNVDFQFAVNTYQSIIGFHITLASIFMLPTVKPLLGVFIEWQALRLQLIILVMRTILCNQFVDNLLPLDFQLFRSFSVVPPAFQDRFGHHEKNTVYETVTRTLALDQFAQNLLLDGTDNGDIGTSDKNGTLRIVALALNTDNQNCSSEPLL